MAILANRIYTDQSDNSNILSPFAPLLSIGAVGAIGMAVAKINRSERIRSSIVKDSFAMGQYRTADPFKHVRESQFKAMNKEAIMSATVDAKKLYMTQLAASSVTKSETMIATEINAAINDLMSLKYSLATKPMSQDLNVLQSTIDDVVHNISLGKEDALTTAKDLLQQRMIDINQKSELADIRNYVGELEKVIGGLDRAQTHYEIGRRQVMQFAKKYGGIKEASLASIMQGTASKLSAIREVAELPPDAETLSKAALKKLAKSWKGRYLEERQSVKKQLLKLAKGIQIDTIKEGKAVSFVNIDRVISESETYFKKLLRPQHVQYLEGLKAMPGGFLPDMVSSPEIKPLLKSLSDGIQKELGIAEKEIAFFSRGSDIICKFVPPNAANAIEIPIAYEQSSLMSLYGHSQITVARKYGRSIDKKRLMFVPIQEDMISQMIDFLPQYRSNAGNKGQNAAYAIVDLQKKIKGVLSAIKRNKIDVTNASAISILNHASTVVNQQKTRTGQNEFVQSLYKRRSGIVAQMNSSNFGPGEMQRAKDLMFKIDESIRKHVNAEASSASRVAAVERDVVAMLREFETVQVGKKVYNRLDIYKNRLTGLNPFTVSQDTMIGQLAYGGLNIPEAIGSLSASLARGAKGALNVAQLTRAAYSGRYDRRAKELLRQRKKDIKIAWDKDIRHPEGFASIGVTTQGYGTTMDFMRNAAATSPTRPAILSARVLLMDDIAAEAGSILVSERFAYAAPIVREGRMDLGLDKIFASFGADPVDVKCVKKIREAIKRDGRIDLLAMDDKLRMHITNRLRNYVKKVDQKPYLDIMLTSLEGKSGKVKVTYNAMGPTTIGTKMWFGGEEKGTITDVMTSQRMARHAMTNLGIGKDTPEDVVRKYRNIYQNVDAIVSMRMFDKGSAGGLTVSVLDTIIEDATREVSKLLGGTLSQHQAKEVISDILKVFDGSGTLSNNFKLEPKIDLTGKHLSVAFPTMGLQDIAPLLTSKEQKSFLVQDIGFLKSLREKLTEIINKYAPNQEVKNRSGKIAAGLLDQVVSLRNDNVLSFFVNANTHIIAIPPDENFRIASGRFEVDMLGGYKRGVKTGLVEQLAMRMNGFNVAADRAQILRRLGQDYVNNYYTMAAMLVDPGLGNELAERFGKGRFWSTLKGTSKREILTPKYLKALKKRIDDDRDTSDIAKLFRNRLEIDEKKLADAQGSLFAKEEVDVIKARRNIKNLVADTLTEVDLKDKAKEMKKQLTNLSYYSATMLTEENYKAYKKMVTKYKFLAFDQGSAFKLTGRSKELSRIPIPGFSDLPTEFIDSVMDSHDVYWLNRKVKKVGSSQVTHERVAVLNRPHSAFLRIMDAYVAGADKEVISTRIKEFNQSIHSHFQQVRRKSMSVGMSGSFQQRALPLNANINLSLLNEKNALLNGPNRNIKKAADEIFLKGGKASPWQPDLGEVWMDKDAFIKTMKSHSGMDKNANREISKLANEIIANERVFMGFGLRQPVLGPNAMHPLRVRLYDSALLKQLRENGPKSLQIADYKKQLYINKLDADAFLMDFDGDTIGLILSHYKNEFNENAEYVASMIRGNSFKFENGMDKIGAQGRSSYYLSNFMDLLDNSSLPEHDRQRLNKVFADSSISVDEYIKDLSISKVEKEHIFKRTKELLKDEYGVNTWKELKELGVRILKPGTGQVKEFYNDIDKLTKARKALIYGLKESKVLPINNERVVKDAVEQAKMFYSSGGVKFDGKEIEDKIHKFFARTGQRGEGATLSLQESIDFNWRAYSTVKAGTGEVYNFVHNYLWDMSASKWGQSAQKTRSIGKYFYGIQQVNISSKHMLPAVAPDYIKTLKDTITLTGSAREMAIRKFQTGDFAFKADDNILYHLTEAGKAAKGDDLRFVSDMVERITQKEGKVFNLKDNSEIFLSEWEKLLRIRQRQTPSIELSANMREGLKSIEKTRNMTKLNDVGIEDLRELADYINQRGFNKSLTHHIMSKVTVNAESQSYLKAFRRELEFKDIDVSAMGEMARDASLQEKNILPIRERSLFDRPNVASGVADSVVRRGKRIVENSELRNYISTKGIKPGMGLTLLGMAALGFAAAAASQPAGAPWLGPQPGYGGEFFERRQRKDEEQLVNSDAVAQLNANYRNVNRFQNFRQPRPARIYIDPQAKRYGTVSQVLDSLHSFRSTANSLQIENPGQTYISSSSTNGYGGF